MRAGTVALALLAVLFLLARPVCAVQDLRVALPHASAIAHVEDVPQGSDHSDPCCEAMEAIVIATPPALAAPATAVALPVPAFVRVPLPIALAHSVFGIPPPPPLSYHARSARIQR